MSADEENGVTVTPPERFAIGLSFGNSNSSIAHTSSVHFTSVSVESKLKLY